MLSWRWLQGNIVLSDAVRGANSAKKEKPPKEKSEVRLFGASAVGAQYRCVCLADCLSLNFSSRLFMWDYVLGSSAGTGTGSREMVFHNLLNAKYKQKDHPNQIRTVEDLEMTRVAS